MEQQIITAWAQVAATVVIGLGQLGMIGWGLRQMGKASEDRNRQMSIDSADRKRQLDQQGAALEKMGQGITDLLQRPA